MRHLSAYALTTLDRALFELGRSKTIEADEQDRIVDAVNWATATMESFTHRRLRSRSYRDTAAIASCGVTAGDATVTGAGFTALYAGDAVVGTGLAPGSRVDSITSAAALELDKPVLTTGTVTLTFGSVSLKQDGDASSTIYIVERPVTTLIAANYFDEDNTATAIDTTGYRLDAETGKLYLPQDAFPSGTMNIELEVVAGYLPPSATDRGHDEWFDLEHWCLRLATIHFQDSIQKRGRIVSETLLQNSSSLPDFKMPDDIADGLQRFVRWW